MTATETRPEARESASEAAPVPLGGLAAVIGTSDHKVVGRLWIGVAFVHLLVAAVAGELLGLERTNVGEFDVLDVDSITQVFTLHSVAGVFLFLLPVFIGLATYVVPLQVGAPTIAFPRAAAAALWGYVLSGAIVIVSYAINGGPGGGDAEGVELFLVSFVALIVALLLGALCVVTTVLTLRAKGMRLDRVPAFSWSMLVAGVTWLLSLPVLVATLVLLYIDVRYGQVFLGGAVEIYPRISWALDQPQTYAYAVPALGIAASIVPVFARQRVAANQVLLAAIALAGVFGFGAFTQRAFNPDLDEEALFVALGVAAVVPALLVVAVIADTLRRGKPKVSGPLALAVLAALVYLDAAVLGAIEVVKTVATDTDPLRGTTWTTAHVHTLLGAAAIGAVAGVVYWAPKLFGKAVKDGPILAVAGLAGLGILALGVADAVSGGLDQAARLGSRQVRDGVEALNAVSAVGGALVVVAVLILLVTLLASLGGDDEAEDDPWGGHTLEWATTSPPPAGNFVEPPEVDSEAPLFIEPADPGNADA